MKDHSKMSKLATPEIKDSQTVKILLCYLLYRIKKPVDSEHLYDIAVTSGIINYFLYQDAIEYLISNNSISVETSGENKIYTLTEKGISCAQTLREYTPKLYRDTIVRAALKYLAKIKYENEVKIDYIKLEKGYYVHCRCPDIDNDLLDLKLYAPDLTQAEMLGKNIMLNPAGFYSRILDIALNNSEEKFDPDEF